MIAKKLVEIEVLSEQLHIWYLEATKKLSPKHYNDKAQVPYKKLTKQQKFIDRYIAKKIIETEKKKEAKNQKRN